VRPLTSARRLAAALLLSAAFVWSVPVGAQGLADPLLRFQTLRTEHFAIYFHQGEEALAARLAVIVEDVWVSMRGTALGVPTAKTHVLLVDQSEVANGFATPIPRNIVFLAAAWPGGSEFLGVTDDWLRLVFTHEFTHIVHLDRSAGWARLVRNVFGRTPLAFPNLFLPAWQIEGLATYQESVLTGQGRLHAGDFSAITREPARGGWPEPLDRVNGGLTDWPDGYAQYAHGAGFHEYLAITFGSEKLGALADATAGRIPYTASRTFKPIFGKPLGALWRDYQAALVETATSAAAEGTATRLTHHGFQVSGPRFTSNDEVIYSIRNADAFPTLNLVRLDRSSDASLATRFGGAAAANGRQTIYFDQLEYERNVGLYGDLYALDRQSGAVRRLTNGARLLDSDISPDGATLVSVRNRPGGRDLVIADLNVLTAGAPSDFDRAVTTLISEPETLFNAPRWSPDGQTIAVERHRLGSLSELVLVNRLTREVRVVAGRSNTRFSTPAWRPDGRAIVAAVAPGDEPFDLYEFSMEDFAARRITHLNGGAMWPDVSPDGKTIVFVGYSVDGQDLFTVPYPSPESAPAAALPIGSRAEQASAPRTGEAVPLPSMTYRPWATLKPTSWFPIVESDADQTRAGASISGVDVLGYHGYAAGATWLVSGPSEGPRPAAGRPDWFAYYTYNRWQPHFWFSATDQTSFSAGAPTDDGASTPATDRTRELEAGIAFPVTRARASYTSAAIFHRAIHDIRQPGEELTRNRSALRGAWTAVTAKTFGYSISPEDGIALGATAEFVSPALGAPAAATTVTADGRVYVRAGGAHRVAAVRFAAGLSRGRADMRRTFLLGGSGPDSTLGGFGRDAIGLLRGFDSNRFAGTHVALVNAEYRLPLFRPQRGLGTWPLFLQTVHAAVFVDAGHAWTRAFRVGDMKTSAGVELSSDLVAGYFLPLTITVGAAAGRDGAGATGGTTVYVRVGRAF
jgi:hypothetical protein